MALIDSPSEEAIKLVYAFGQECEDRGVIKATFISDTYELLMNYIIRLERKCDPSYVSSSFDKDY